MQIKYYLVDSAYKKYHSKLRELAARPDIVKVCDVGGGANPLLSTKEIREYGLDYTLLDISSEQLLKAPDEYHKIQANIADPSFFIDEKYDLVCSQFLAEHIPDAKVFHTNIFNILRNGGCAFHYFPTLYNLPFIANLILPEYLSESILILFHPNRQKEGKNAKFPAYYNWCMGPTTKNINNFKNLGYGVEEYIGFFGHDYYHKIDVFDKLEAIKSKILVKYPISYLTQFAHILLQKP
jgi:SAM-dependent methyltransferase